MNTSRKNEYIIIDTDGTPSSLSLIYNGHRIGTWPEDYDQLPEKIKNHESMIGWKNWYALYKHIPWPRHAGPFIFRLDRDEDEECEEKECIIIGRVEQIVKEVDMVNRFYEIKLTIADGALVNNSEYSIVTRSGAMLIGKRYTGDVTEFKRLEVREDCNGMNRSDFEKFKGQLVSAKGKKKEHGNTVHVTITSIDFNERN